jgi:hypothetical protein
MAEETGNTLRLLGGTKMESILVDNSKVMTNSAVYAMKTLQAAMAGEAEKAGLYSDDDVTRMIMEMRAPRAKKSGAGLAGPGVEF